ncbi:MAG: hypothetical protein AVDCRST_MAG18-5211 [uncultured Thermomicrobiales bacterium]|uniref:DinB-like domain-containing protein n=1 Tax=uncultured Thermomicrobiales bacterium TaxID=1645740 RepID=A0A6N3IPK8_9BACT|nr:MAG: hypothetical protein AVDCRST_MAG18-5211 [uncultured Thermomicrobiales bacterium]
MPTRPTADESISYYQRYIALVPDGDLLAILARQAREVAALLADCSPAQAQRRPAPGEWNAIEIVGHLADTERVLAYRALRIARRDPTPLEGVGDFAAYVTSARFAGRSLADVVAEYAAVRGASLALFRSLDAADWAQIGVADGDRISVRALAYIIAGHDLHHLPDLRTEAGSR